MKDLLKLLTIAGLLVGVFAGAIWASSLIKMPNNHPLSSERSHTTTEEPSDLPLLGTLPPIDGIAGWINTDKLTQEDLQGNVVLVDFWTYSCINCIRTLPYIQAWHEAYQDDGLLILGVHTPEFGFEKVYDNVVAAATKHGLTYPIAQDNDFTTWNNFSNRYWPAKYLFDRDGNLRYYHFGEGSYDEAEAAIVQLLGTDVAEMFVQANTPDRKNISSPETYFGWWRAENFVSPEGIIQDETITYTAPGTLALNQWSLSGDWSVEYQHSQAQSAGARFAFRYSASVANLVMATSNNSLQDVVVYLDGAPVPPELLGAHTVTDELTSGTFVQVDVSDLFEIVSGAPGEHLLEIEALEPGLQIYAITFG